MRYLSILILLGLAMACNYQNSAERKGKAEAERKEKARLALRDSLLGALSVELDSLNGWLAEIRESERALDSIWQGKPKDSDWYREKKAALAGFKAVALGGIRDREQRRAALVGGD